MASGGAAAAIVRAIKAPVVIVRVDPGEFSKLMNRANDPLIVLAGFCITYDHSNRR